MFGHEYSVQYIRLKEILMYFLLQKHVQEPVLSLCRSEQSDTIAKGVWSVIFSAAEANGFVPLSTFKSMFEWSLRRISKTSVDFDASATIDTMGRWLVFSDLSNYLHGLSFADLILSTKTKIAGNENEIIFTPVLNFESHQGSDNRLAVASQEHHYLIVRVQRTLSSLPFASNAASAAAAIASRLEAGSTVVGQWVALHIRCCPLRSCPENTAIPPIRARTCPRIRPVALLRSSPLTSHVSPFEMHIQYWTPGSFPLIFPADIASLILLTSVPP
jgi:hypothetical protein